MGVVVFIIFIEAYFLGWNEWKYGIEKWMAGLGFADGVWFLLMRMIIIRGWT